MKVFLRTITLTLAVVFMVSVSSCSKKNYSSKSYAKRGSSSSTIDPVTKKSEPVRKTYIVPQKKKKVLGQEKPKI